MELSSEVFTCVAVEFEQVSNECRIGLGTPFYATWHALAPGGSGAVVIQIEPGLSTWRDPAPTDGQLRLPKRFGYRLWGVK